MGRRIRNASIFMAVEATYGAAITYIAADAVLVSELTATFPRNGVKRDLIRNYLGGAEELVGTRQCVLEFMVEMAGSGALGVAPKWGKLLRCCSMQEAISASNRVEYTPSNPVSSAGFRFENDGVRYVVRGAMGTVKLSMNAYERPMFSFRFVGFDVAATAVANLAPDFTGWIRPEVVSDANSGSIKLGGTYATGTVTGGTALVTRAFELEVGNTVEHMELLGSGAAIGESIDITNREATGSITVELSTADEVQWRTDLNANTLTGLSFTHGSTAGNRIVVDAPSIQRLNNQVLDYKGRALTSADIRCLPVSTAGNDEFRIVAR